jgi:hypothetical protein
LGTAGTAFVATAQCMLLHTAQYRKQCCFKLKYVDYESSAAAYTLYFERMVLNRVQGVVVQAVGLPWSPIKPLIHYCKYSIVINAKCKFETE